jgi:fused signal recognition particle receptor
LFLDGNTGQNAVSQAKLFHETAKLTGLVLTKLDGTAKGRRDPGVAKNRPFGPGAVLGMGEKIDDLIPFDSKTFVQALFDKGES